MKKNKNKKAKKSATNNQWTSANADTAEQNPPERRDGPGGN